MTENTAPENSAPKAPRKPRKPRAPRLVAPQYTGPFAGGNAITYPESRVLTEWGKTPLRVRIRVALLILRGRIVCSNGDHTVIVKKGAVPNTTSLASILGGVPDNHPSARLLLG